jgi:hypothetical protein
MAMPLWQVRERDELGIAEVFEGIAPEDIRSQILELHGTHDDDANYVFMFWLTDDANEERIIEQLQENAAEVGAELTEVVPRLFMWQEDVTKLKSNSSIY